jgi:rubrerythrin
MEHNTNGIIPVTSAVHSRRNVLKGASAALAAIALTSASPFAAGRAFAASTLDAEDLTDLDILNFALTLEHLEAEFYKEVVGGGQLSGQALTILTDIRDHEIAHVEALTDVISKLGGTPVQAQDSYNFGDLSSQEAILETSQALEETGVGAYTGAAALIDDKTTLLPAAASIEQVEARHAAAVRFLRGQPVAPEAYGPVLTVAEVTEIVAPILGS